MSELLCVTRMNMKHFTDREIYLMMQVVPAIRSYMNLGQEFDLIEWLNDQIADNGMTVADAIDFEADTFVWHERNK